MTTTYIQDPDEKFYYHSDWNTYLASQGDPTITSLTVVVDTDLLTSESQSYSLGITTSFISVKSGVEEGTSTCVHRVLLSDSQVVEWPFKIKIKSNNEG